MNPSIETLTDKQLEALKGVAEYKSAKEIARDLGVGSHAIEARLKSVRAILGVQSSADAARLYREQVKIVAPAPGGALGDLVYGSPELPTECGTGEKAPSPGTWNRSDDEPMTLHQPQAPYVGDWVHEAPARSFSTVLFEAGRTNELSPIARTLCIGALTLLAILSMAFAVSLAEGLSRLF